MLRENSPYYMLGALSESTVRVIMLRPQVKERTVVLVLLYWFLFLIDFMAVPDFTCPHCFPFCVLIFSFCIVSFNKFVSIIYVHFVGVNCHIRIAENLLIGVHVSLEFCMSWVKNIVHFFRILWSTRVITASRINSLFQYWYVFCLGWFLNISSLWMYFLEVSIRLLRSMTVLRNILLVWRLCFFY